MAAYRYLYIDLPVPPVRARLPPEIRHLTRTAYTLTRLILNMNRAVPEIVYALIFVAAVGLGPFGGVLRSLSRVGRIHGQDVCGVHRGYRPPTGPGDTCYRRKSPTVVHLWSHSASGTPSRIYLSLPFRAQRSSGNHSGPGRRGRCGFHYQQVHRALSIRRLLGAMILIIITVTIIDRVSDYLRKKII